MTDAVRKEFEAWCVKRWGGDRGDDNFLRYDDSDKHYAGQYRKGNVEFAWCAWAAARAALSEQPSPIDMVLHCPVCGVQHIDAPEFNGTREDKFPAFGEDPAMSWTNPPHRSHLCAGCGHIWRPADVPTNGVAAVKTKGKADSPLATPARRGAL